MLNGSTGYLALDSIVLIIAAICVICPLTYLYTYIRFQIDYRNGGQGTDKPPPTLPYWIPYLGSALAMRSPHQVFIRAQYVYDPPCKTRLIPSDAGQGMVDPSVSSLDPCQSFSFTHQGQLLKFSRTPRT
jgi:hypothetical protein